MRFLRCWPNREEWQRLVNPWLEPMLDRIAAGTVKPYTADWVMQRVLDGALDLRRLVDGQEIGWALFCVENRAVRVLVIWALYIRPGVEGWEEAFARATRTMADSLGCKVAEMVSPRAGWKRKAKDLGLVEVYSLTGYLVE